MFYTLKTFINNIYKIKNKNMETTHHKEFYIAVSIIAFAIIVLQPLAMLTVMFISAFGQA